MEKDKIIEQKLSYKIQGIFIQISKEYGCNFKEYVYQEACIRAFKDNQVNYISKPLIDVYSKFGKPIGFFIPDFVIENKIIVEIKALKMLMENSISQLLKYLEKSNYEVGYVINFGTSFAQIVRRVYSNENKIWRQYIANQSPMTRINASQSRI